MGVLGWMGNAIIGVGKGITKGLTRMAEQYQEAYMQYKDCDTEYLCMRAGNGAVNITQMACEVILRERFEKMSMTELQEWKRRISREENWGNAYKMLNIVMNKEQG